ncbi:MAG: ATPase, T2SS/T4P/T4SS family, partial [Patescibacteria group bacterium]
MPDLLQILLETGKISETQHKEITAKAKAEKKTVEEELVSLNLISEADFYKTQAASLGIEYIDLSGQEISQEILNIIPEELAKNYHMIAFARQGKTFSVALTDPKNFKAREAVEYMGRNQGFKVKYFLTNKTGFEYALKKYSSIRQEVTEALTSAEEKFHIQGENDENDENDKHFSNNKKEKEIKEVLKHAPITKMVSVILRNAVEGKASDIHIEPLQNISRIRYRKDGELKTTISLPIYLHSAIIARIKVMANLKIDETRIPQDGRFRLNFTDKEVDFRVSVLPLLNRE